MMSNGIERFIKNDRFAGMIGVEIVEHGLGTAKARLELREEHLNSAGTAHGGLIFSLADAVFSVASNSHGTLAMAINVSISFFKAVREGTLTADGREISFNPRLATYLIEVRDETGDLVASFQGTVYRKRDLLEDILQ
jgi:acyl-CoA thioesterase